MEKLIVENEGKEISINVPYILNLGGFLRQLRSLGIKVYHESELAQFGYFRRNKYDRKKRTKKEQVKK